MVVKQSGWRWCSSCEGLFFSENGTRGRCVADSHGHDATGSANYLVALERSDRLEQEGWRWCRKCQGLFFGGHDTEGVCPADRGQHDASASGNYVLAGEAMEDSEQNGWRWCSRCESLFFAGSSAGACSSGGTHDPSGSGNYALELDLSDSGALGNLGGGGFGGISTPGASQPPLHEDDIKSSWCIPHQGMPEALIGQVFFSTDSDFLDPNDTNALNNLIEALSELPSFLPGSDPVKILFRGSADPRGNPAHNLDLSSRRAVQAQRYVVNSLPAGDLRFETDTRALGAKKQLPVFSSLAYERRVDIFTVGGAIGKPVPPPSDLDTQRRRIVRLLTGPTFFPTEMRKRMLCVFSPQIKKFDQYLHPMDPEFHDGLGSLGTPRMPDAKVGEMLNRHTIRKEIMHLSWSPAFPDSVIAQDLVHLDVNILSGIAMIDAADRFGELNASSPFTKQMKDLVANAQEDPNSIYSCYR